MKVKKSSKWTRSNGIDAGISLETSKSSYSVIHYPLSYNVRVKLPSLNSRSLMVSTSSDTPIPLLFSADDELKNQVNPISNGISLLSLEKPQTIERIDIENRVKNSLIGSPVMTLRFGSNFKRVPIPLMKQSSTVSHILSSSKGFLEGLTSEYSFPTIEFSVFEEILAYLYYLMDPFEKPPFEVDVECVLEVMEAALYWDLPGLVDTCAKKAALFFNEITSFGGLPNILIRDILNHVSIEHLIQAEHVVLPQTLLENWHAGKKMPNLVSAWSQKLNRVLQVMSNRDSDFFETLKSRLLSNPKWLVSKCTCVEFYVSEHLAQSVALFPPGLNQAFKFEGRILVSLSLHLMRSRGPSSHVWKQALDFCPRLNLIQVVMETTVHPALAPILFITAKRGIRVVLKPILIGLDSTSVDEMVGHFLVKSIKSDTTPHCKIVRMETESELDIKGISSLQEYLIDPQIISNEPIKQVKPDLGFGSIECLKPTKHQDYCSPNVFVTWLRHSLSIHTIELRKCSLQDHILGPSLGSTLALTLSNPNSCLSDLNVSNTHLGSAGLLSLFQSLVGNQTLTKLNVSKNIEAQDKSVAETMKCLASILEHNQSALKSLDLSHNHLSSIGIIALMECLPDTHLQTLRLDKVALGTHAKHLFKKWSENQGYLSSLSTRHNGCLPRTLLQSLDILYSSQSKHITSLDLSENVFDEVCLRPLISWLRCDFCCLVSLALDGSVKSDIHQCLAIPVLKDLLNVATKSKTLLTLSLNYQHVPDELLPAILDCIRSSKLKVLSLKCNLLSDKSLSSMIQLCARRLKRPHLIYIDLSINWFSPECILKHEAFLYIDQVCFFNVIESQVVP